MATTRREMRIQEIARAAVGPLNEHGFRNARLSDIGAEIGMSAAHLLYYFDSKNGLFMAALDIAEQDLRDAADTAFGGLESASERWRWLIESVAPSGVHDSTLLMWLEAWSEAAHDDDVRALVARLEESWQEQLRGVLEYGVGRGEVPADVDIDDVIEAFSALFDGLTIRVVTGYRAIDKERVLRICDDFVCARLGWDPAVAPPVR